LAERRGRVLIIGGSDSGGGAGIQADIKTVTILGGYAATAVTAITVQNTLGVSAIRPLSADLVRAQAVSVWSDIGADGLKTGALCTAAVVECTSEVLEMARDVPAVVDPVIVATGGQILLSRRGVQALRSVLVPMASLLTPNAPEAAVLTGNSVANIDELRAAGEALMRLGAVAVLMKGGHLAGETVTDILMTPAGERRFEAPRVVSRHTHGTGCTLASACATGLAQGMSLEAAVERAWGYTAEAIRRAPGFGAGHGPIDHGWPLRT
jgi:hydroxymethylpyrimidine/phosphomethylpyrimidine kinase